ncbi:uncharacterized protein LOC126665243 [Mercurialis annua]|uniref:uncharacterized protein LOC126665243 n=1 Tax=Mercurialis annua TaxID=3986 RepID=UPI00215E0401|nr:uncharacterized protein LOC126665243 [Mercurialis annua]
MEICSDWKCLWINTRFYKLQNFIKNRWEKIGMIEFHQVKPNLFAFVFESEEGKMKAMADGPITFDKHPLILQEWTKNMSFDVVETASVPVWVKFSMLLWEFWNPNSLSSIASILGRPLFADKCTRDRSRLAYARVLIEMKLNGVFPDIVVIEDGEGMQHTQMVEYEWKPIVCEVCNKLGHRNCEVKQIWIAKKDKEEAAVNITQEVVTESSNKCGKENDTAEDRMVKTPVVPVPVVSPVAIEETPMAIEEEFQLVTNKKKNRIISRDKSGGNTQANRGNPVQVNMNVNDKLPNKRIIKPLDRGK